MSKKSKKKKQRHISAQSPAKILFTFEAVKILRDSLRLMDEALLRNTKPFTHLELALETLLRLKTKIHNMLELEDWEQEIPFDYNEIHLLYAAVHMYLVDLKFANKNALLTPCLNLCKQLSRIVAHVEMK